MKNQKHSPNFCYYAMMAGTAFRSEVTPVECNMLKEFLQGDRKIAG
jgi:hypothetical protein